MSSKTKIFVLHMKEVILTIAFIAVLILLMVFLIFALSPSDDTDDSSIPTPAESTPPSAEPYMTTAGAVYIPGIYRTTLYLSDRPVHVEVTVDETSITSLALLNVSDATATMYPLLTKTFENIRDQIYLCQDPGQVTYEQDNKYTSLVLLEAISKALEKAALP